MVDFLLHVLGFCPDHLSHIDLADLVVLDMSQVPSLLLHLYRDFVFRVRSLFKR